MSTTLRRTRTGLYIPRSTGYVATILADSPLVLWEMGEASGTTMVDSSGNGHDGAYAATTLGGASLLPTYSGTCATFTGSAGTHSSGSLGGQTWMNVAQMTAECWVSTTDTDGVIFARRSGGSSTGWSFYMQSSGSVQFVFINGGSTSGLPVIATGTGLNDGHPHYLVSTYDGADVRVYVDGTQVATTAYTGAIPTNTTQPLSVGGANTGVDHYLAGSMQMAALYDHALTAGRIAAHYAAA